MYLLGLMGTLLQSLQIVVADLPVHCVRHQMAGDWVFKLGPLSDTRTACGHVRPDDEGKQPSRSLVDLAATTELKLTLASPNLVTVHHAKPRTGTWTMVYDEGFEVKADTMSFFAFSNWTMVANAANPEEKLHNVSHCEQTAVGWYQDEEIDAHGKKQKKYGCYYGMKAPGSPAAIAATVAGAASKAAVVAPEKSTFNKPLDTHAQKHSVNRLNKKLCLLQLGWTAGPMVKWLGKSLREVNDYVGLKRSTPRKDTHREMMTQRQTMNREGALSFLQEPPSSLPKSWDWSNANGVNFLEAVVDQGDCGSCYALSAVRMLTARHKIKQNTTKLVPWSIGFPLFCSEYNQGCGGGYGILLAKWSEDVGLLPATCMRYNAAGTCKLECDLDSLGKRHRAGNHRYVGGSYQGHTNEQAMMKELKTNGPMVIGIEPTEDFMFYSEGIYKSAPKNHSANEEWQQVDHAVLLVGYGEENGAKYWKVQNSWGDEWGEQGFFRIARGSDESAVESMAEAAEVVEDETNGARVQDLFNDQRENEKKKPKSSLRKTVSHSTLS